MTWLAALVLLVACSAGFPSLALAQTASGSPGTAVPEESVASQEVAIRLAGKPTFRRHRNDTTVVLGGDLRVRAEYLVVDASGKPRPDMSLVIYARGDGPLARASVVSDDRGVARGDLFFQIDPGLSILMQACRSDDPGTCSPQHTLNLRQRMVISIDTTTAYALAPNLPPISVDHAPTWCQRLPDCGATLRLFSATAANQLEIAAVTRARLTLRETTRRGRHNKWSAFVAMPLLFQTLWSSSLFGSGPLDSALALGDYSFGATVSGKAGYVEAAFDGRTPTSTAAIDRFVSGSRTGVVNSRADGFRSVEFTGQVNANVASRSHFFVNFAVSKPFPRQFKQGQVGDKWLTDITAQPGARGQAYLGLGFAPGGQAFSLTPWAGISVQEATRLVSKGSAATAFPASTNVLAGLQYADLRGGPLTTMLGATVSGLTGGQLVVNMFISVSARELFVVRPR